MDHQDVYRELSKKLMMENSTVLPRIWRLVCTDEEAEILNRLPATVDQLSSALGKPAAELQALFDKLFHRGAVFELVKDGTISYRIPRHVVQFHDANINWPEAPEELLELWREFAESDYPQLLELVTSVNLPSFMRVVPIGETIETTKQVLAYEDAATLLKNAGTIALTGCPCRKLMKRCDKPVEACIQLDRGAEYVIKRGTGRRIDVQEALNILKLSEKAGLVHMTENTAGRSNVICNCCSCCCEMLRFAADVKTKGVIAPSRYLARVDEEDCTSCGACVEICPVGAVSLNGDDLAEVNADECIGCGLCADTCPVQAIRLEEVRPVEFIPK